MTADATQLDRTYARGSDPAERVVSAPARRARTSPWNELSRGGGSRHAGSRIGSGHASGTMRNMSISANVDSPAPAWKGWTELVLAIIPVAAFGAAAVFLEAKGPFWLGINSDPDYCYLLNALSVARGIPPGHVDHPGTLVHVIGAIVVRATHGIIGERDLVADVVRRPELYLRAIQYVLFALYASGLYLVGRVAHAALRRLDSAVLAQASPFLSTIVLPHVACVKPEPVLATISAFMGAAAVAVVRRAERGRSSGVAVAMGVLSGAALATKINGAPLLLVPLIVLRGWASRGIFAATAAFAAALFTIPAWPLFHQFLSFLRNSFGNGPRGHIDLASYPAVVLDLLRGEPVMAAGLLVGVGAMIAVRRGGEAPDGARTSTFRRALVAMIAAQVACVLLVAKHPSDQFLAPGHHYLIPALGLTGAVLALSWTLLAQRFATAGRAMLVTAVAAALAVGVAQAAAFRSVHRYIEDQRDAQVEIAAFTKSQFPARRVLYYYRSSSPSFALHFGNAFAGWRYGKDIGEAWPESAYYNRYTGEIELYRPVNGERGASPTTVQLDAEPLVIQGTPLTFEQAVAIPFGMPTRIKGNDQEAVYEIREHARATRGALIW